MPVLEHTKTKAAVDNDGYLLNFNDWNEDVARELAARAGVELSDGSVSILKFIRDHYRTYHFFPIVNAICTRLHEPKHCLAEKFPNPLVAWKIAGLPHPEEPIISLLEAGQSPG
jgi:TusE/DsrC/DsvC family sulfur relay protein